MKSVIHPPAVLVCLATTVAAAPKRQTFQDERQAAISRDDRQDSGDGNFENENGIIVSPEGIPYPKGQNNLWGNYRFTIAEEGHVVDEFGFGTDLISSQTPLPPCLRRRTDPLCSAATSRFYLLGKI
ncbi:cuticle protein AMP1B-like [Penaeus japonicus]|uniref:cuticle protein AMP1B-like n=1 Tax=Penaeus japonicus TaxID=27405 RepID=UPI001C7123F3|nr:cuticle protein AMP1B-like [Penaeus japonicus]